MQETRVRSLGWEDPLEKEWQPTPVFLPGKSYGWRSLVGYSPWGHKESDTTEQLSLTHSLTASSRSSHIHTLTQYLVKKRIRSKSNNKKDEMTGKLSVNTRNKAYNETRANKSKHEVNKIGAISFKIIKHTLLLKDPYREDLTRF